MRPWCTTPLRAALAALSLAGALAVPAIGHALAIPAPVRGVRVDPSYLYGLGLDVDATIEAVLDDCARMGANTVFLRAYNPAYGAFYDPQGYAHTEVEAGYGAADFLGRFLPEAHARGLAVVAWLPVNAFASVWRERPDWRQKTLSGDDYRPASTLLSVRSGFRPWLVGLIEDLLVHYPDLDGIEAAEATIDELWDNGADYHSSMTAGFTGSFDSPEWKAHRALGLTELHDAVFGAVRAAGKPAFVVQTWAAGADGSLLSSEAIRDGSGFDWDGILDLGPDYAMAELMFQQWRALFPDGGFSAAWTAAAAAEFVARTAGRAAALIHVEASRIGVQPSATEFASSLQLALAAPGAGGADFYDYWLARTRHLLPQVAAVYAPGSACTRGACAPGGGSRTTDCAAEWQTLPLPAPGPGGLPGRTLDCPQGDPVCDAGTNPYGCAIRVSLCAGNHDPSLAACEPGPLAAIEVLRPSAAQASRSPGDAARRAALLGAIGGLPLASPDACSAAATIEVPLAGAPGRPRPGSAALRIRATAASGAVDVDALRLRCLP